MKLSNSIKELYLSGYSARELKEELHISVSVRQIQRWIKEAGISRSSADSFRMALKRGQVKHVKNEKKLKRVVPPKWLRDEVMSDDGNKCRTCGSTIQLEVDHIDNNPSNNVRKNLQTLCHKCNHEKAEEYYKSIGRRSMHSFTKDDLIQEPW